MDIALGQAQDRLKSGAFKEAEQLFKNILDDHPQDAEALHGLGLAAGQQGQTERAVDLIKSAIEVDPDQAKFYGNLSVFARSLNRVNEALEASGKAIALAPDNAVYWNNRGNALAQAGRIADAIASFEKATSLNPSYSEAYFNLGNALKDSEKLADAVTAYQSAVTHSPKFWMAFSHLGECLYSLKQGDDALAAYEKAHQLNPQHLPTMVGLGKSFHRLNRFDEALSVFEQVVALVPDHDAGQLCRGRCLIDLKRYPEAKEVLTLAVKLLPSDESYVQLGIACAFLGHKQEALHAFNKSLDLNPKLLLAYFHKSNLLRKAGRLDEALDAVMKAIEIKPDLAELWNSLGNVAKVKWQLHAARDAFEKALELDPNLDAAVNNLAGIYKGLAVFKRARDLYDQSLQLSPKNLNFTGNLLFCANYDPDVSEEDLADLHRQMAAQLQEGIVPKTAHTNEKDPDKRLRIGLVSGDFGRHPTGYFLEGVLRYADPKEVAYYCYSNRHKEDELTARLKGYADAWRPIHGLSADDMCALIEKDEIDILIDLSGYTAETRLDCFAQRPAPIQMTWLGSCHTTGMSTIDYIILDPHYVRPGDEDLFTEEFIRLPDIRWVYKLRDNLPDTAPPPALKNGHITFGSFNNLTKVNDDVIELWAAVLNAVPDAKMILSWRSLAETREQDRIARRFADYGVPADRLILTHGHVDGRSVLEEYDTVDIALDTFPFSGCITTCEALSMGVPIVALPGRRPSSRQTYGFLKAIGRDEWIASSRQEFVNIAAKLASDPQKLADMRAAQRERVVASPMCDAKKFCGHLEAAFRDAWVKWCNS